MVAWMRACRCGTLVMGVWNENLFQTSARLPIADTPRRKTCTLSEAGVDGDLTAHCQAACPPALRHACKRSLPRCPPSPSWSSSTGSPSPSSPPTAAPLWCSSSFSPGLFRRSCSATTSGAGSSSTPGCSRRERGRCDCGSWERWQPSRRRSCPSPWASLASTTQTGSLGASCSSRVVRPVCSGCSYVAA